MHFLDARRGVNPYELADVRRPHVFVFTVDMIPPEFHREPSPCRGAMRMPAWDALVADSVCFDNAFSVSPLCGPSRASLFTGRYPYITVNEERAHDGAEVELRADDPIYPDYLKAAGYVMGHVGKSHIGTASFMRVFGESCSPWNRWAPPLYDDPEYHEYLRGLGVDGFRLARKIQGVATDGESVGNLYGGWLEQDDGESFPMAGTYPHYLVERALSTLRSLRGRGDEGQACYLQLDLFAPHQPFMIPSGMEDREQVLREDVPLPPGYVSWQERGFGGAGPEPKIYTTYERSWGLFDQRVARDYQIANMLQMEVIDAALARFVGGLKELGLYEESVVLLTADHGEMNLERGLVDKGVYGHPKVARIPMCLKLPGCERRGLHVDTDVSLLDVAPTLLGMAGVCPCARLDGTSLLDLMATPGAERETPFVFEAGWHVAPNPAVAIHGRSAEGHFRYVYNASSFIDELYDLDDPCHVNHIDNADLSHVRRAMRVRLASVVNGDARWRCYRQAFELDRAEDLPSKAGDRQMFIPE
ncbi:MAG: sulfatase-like hydrolase/transferase [Lentisphaeria bacterium]|nr:sulfatase-like hydrolase/transferase [Lentisphaeria bacterium]